MAADADTGRGQQGQSSQSRDGRRSPQHHHKQPEERWDGPRGLTWGAVVAGACAALVCAGIGAVVGPIASEATSEFAAALRAADTLAVCAAGLAAMLGFVVVAALSDGQVMEDEEAPAILRR